MDKSLLEYTAAVIKVNDAINLSSILQAGGRSKKPAKASTLKHAKAATEKPKRAASAKASRA